MQKELSYKKFVYRKLDPVLSTPVRLAVVSALVKVKQADFNYLLEIVNTTQGNLSHQLKRLKEEEYIEIEKTFNSNYPQTICRLSSKGRKAFQNYVEDIKKYLHL
jgi:DNA-binding transcriptional ArsR family regulator